MSTSLISKLCEKFRSGMVKVCVTVGTVLIVIAVSAILLPFVLGVLLVAWAQRTAEQNTEPTSIVVIPASA